MVGFIVFLLICLGVAWMARDRRIGFLGALLISLIVSPFVALLSVLIGEGFKSTRT